MDPVNCIKPLRGWDKLPVELQELIIQDYIAAILSDLKRRGWAIMFHYEANKMQAQARMAKLAAVSYSFGHEICLKQLEKALVSIEEHKTPSPSPQSSKRPENFSLPSQPSTRPPMQRRFAQVHHVPFTRRANLQRSLEHTYQQQRDVLIRTIQALKAQAVSTIVICNVSAL